jgi:pimeloyl-ACP methyl ester carboxylesterase
MIKPFTVSIPQHILDDLQERLAHVRWPDEIEQAKWALGADLSYMKDLVDYWRTRFDWRQQENQINSFKNFRLEVDGFGVHFIHERGKGPNSLPLVITHGWPGSFVEMLKIIPALVDPAAHGGDECDSFDVVVPSMPGYGFSDRPSQGGMNVFRIADLWVRLMNELGYQRFAAQGGDWGASVATCLGLEHAESLIGIHLNYIPGSFKPFIDAGSRPLSNEEKSFLEDAETWYQAEGAYGHVQKTKPQTLAYALNDSPVGLAAWIVEKFRDWGDCDGEVERRFSKDELLTNIVIYWVSETINSSMRLYHEGSKRPVHFQPGQFVNVPVGVTRFGKEAPFPPKAWVERGYNIQRWTEFPLGGHFAAMEEPELLVEDIRAFFRPLREESIH